MGQKWLRANASSTRTCPNASGPHLTRARPELFDTLSAWRERGEIKPAEYAHERENAEQLVVRWFAPGVGLVKEQIGSAIIRVLTGIEKEGTGLTDTTRLEQYEIQG